jgi:hypothetical protein
LATLLAGLAIAGADASRAAQAPVEIALNPVADTYLGTGRDEDDSKELVTGWSYAARPREFRAYVAFPLDPELHPPAGLRRATLSLYPSDPADSSQIYATYVVRPLAEPLASDRRSGWFATTDPAVERQIGTERMTWKSWDVTDIAREMIRDPDTAYGFEIAGKEPADNTKLFFQSMEGADPGPEGYQPTLLLMYDPSAFPTPTSDATRTPKPTTTPIASATPRPSETTAPTPTAAPTSTPSLAPAFVPRAER